MQKRAPRFKILLKLNPCRSISAATSATYSTTTIPCSGSNTSTTNLIWRFNQDQIILNQTKTSLPLTVSEAWRKHVKGVSDSGSLTLQDMTSEQEGVYTCELSDEDGTIITNISVRISQGEVKGHDSLNYN